jgi:hypothetical protein
MQFWIGIILIVFIAYVVWNVFSEYRKTKQFSWKKYLLETIIVGILLFMFIKLLVFKF